jgi:hypothetical protein
MARKRASEQEVVVSASTPVRHKTAASRRLRRSTAEPAVSRLADIAAPTHEQIAHLAYSYWEARGFQGGSSEEDWLRAEQELLAHASAV